MHPEPIAVAPAQIVQLERSAKVAMTEQRYSPHSIWTCKGGSGGSGTQLGSGAGT
jgi:hypothetical protein